MSTHRYHTWNDGFSRRKPIRPHSESYAPSPLCRDASAVKDQRSTEADSLVPSRKRTTIPRRRQKGDEMAVSIFDDAAVLWSTINSCGIDGRLLGRAPAAEAQHTNQCFLDEWLQRIDFYRPSILSQEKSGQSEKKTGKFGFLKTGKIALDSSEVLAAPKASISLDVASIAVLASRQRKEITLRNINKN